MDTFSFKITLRGFSLFLINVLAIAFFYRELTVYLAPLQKPIPLVLAFLLTLLLSILMELRYGFNRFVMIQLTTTVLVFICGTFIAHGLRELYLFFISILIAEPELDNIIGTDYYAALINPSIGYGGCFATGLSFSRLFIWK